MTVDLTERMTGSAPTSPARRLLCLSPARAFALPFFFTLGLLTFILFHPVRQNPRLWLSFAGTAAVLLAWTAVQFTLALRNGRTFTLETAMRPQHYVQACVQTAIYVYWGWYWRPVYHWYYLVVAQLAFAYAFDILLSWSRRDSYTLGFGPFPVIFSINLFLWFKPEWFYLQFMMVGLGFAAKELIRWNKEGRRVHIFNPSSFPLMIFSIGLIALHASDITSGNDIAITQAYPPHMYLYIFLIGLTGQYFFGVVAMTMSAVLTTYLFGLAYLAATGVYFFYDSFIPIAVFNGMFFLFTDPATSPRTELGRIIFGILYGLGVVAAFAALRSAGIPAFYDKLLPVPILNVAIQLIDRAPRSKLLGGLDPSALGRSLVGRRRNLAYMAIWAIIFVIMSAVQGVGDDHPGQWLPFWQQACGKGRANACRYVEELQTNYCNLGSGWACNELGLMHAARLMDRADVVGVFEHGCTFGFQPACANADHVATGTGDLRGARPRLEDYPIILRTNNKGPITDRTPSRLYEVACKQGWPDTCEHSSQVGKR
jgi:hypothetical protein